MAETVVRFTCLNVLLVAQSGLVEMVASGLVEMAATKLTTA
jgi:hypothetical protein